MDSNETVVWVYRYRYWDPKSNEMVTAAREATLEAIKNGLGIPVIESGRKVTFSHLDRHGRVQAGGAPAG
jgi:hypothetical protein